MYTYIHICIYMYIYIYVIESFCCTSETIHNIANHLKLKNKTKKLLLIFFPPQWLFRLCFLHSLSSSTSTFML